VQGGLLSHGYDGNGFWAASGLFALGLLGYILFTYRRKRKLGDEIEIRKVIFISLFCLGFVCQSIYEILTHL
jgi:hypothetical protein